MRQRRQSLQQRASPRREVRRIRITAEKAAAMTEEIVTEERIVTIVDRMDGLRVVTVRIVPRAENALRVVVVRMVPVRGVIATTATRMAADVTDVLRTDVVRKVVTVVFRTDARAAVRKVVGATDVLRMAAEMDVVRIVTAADRDVLRMGSVHRADILHREDMMDKTEEEQAMANLRLTDRMALRDLPDLALKVARVSAAVAAVTRAAAAVLVVIARVTELAADREIDSAVSQKLRALQQKLLPKTWKRSVKKKRDASVRRKINATARI